MKRKCLDCGQVYDGTLESCPTCGCPSSENAVVEAPSQIEGLDNNLALDDNNNLTFEKIIHCEGKSKEQLFIVLNFWVSINFNHAQSVIQLNDKQLGVIICQGYLNDIADNLGLVNRYTVSVKPIFKIDIKDEKIRVTYIVGWYEVFKSQTSGVIGMISSKKNEYLSDNYERWPLNETYPFVKKDGHEKTSKKALISTLNYTNYIISDIEKTVKKGIAGNEFKDW